ncbi:MAG: gamma-glutamyl-gamma-aminobutyrate hydrolase family protein [Acidimicrobiales bacterium]
MPSPSTRPLIGVTSYRQDTRWWSWDRDAAVVPGVYLDMVVAAGGWPVLIPPTGDGAGGDGAGGAAIVAAVVDPLLDALDGLVVIGGGDVSARRYGQEPDPRNGGVSDRRDELEFELLGAALERDLPILAVCRGHQVLNVLLGGSLIQQLPDVLGSTDHQPRAGAFGEVTVRTEPSTHVHRLLGSEAVVLCSHHQAIDALGESLLVSARSDDGVIEAVEVLGRTFAVGVQWHPEENGDVRLFAGLVDATRSAGTRPTSRSTAEEHA